MSLDCRPGCGACCISPSITTPMPKMLQGKPAGVPCAHLMDDYLCELFGQAERPEVCGGFQAADYVCGTNREQAIELINLLEQATG